MTSGSPMSWAVFGAVIVIMLALDLVVFHRQAHAIGLARSSGLVGGLDRRRPAVQCRRSPPASDRTARWSSSRLAHREGPLGRQPLRVPGDLPLLRGAGPPAAPGAVLGHHRRARHARPVHRAGRRAARDLSLGHLHLRRVPDLHRRAPAARSDDGDPHPEKNPVLRLFRRFVPDHQGVRGPASSSRAGRQAATRRRS